MVWEGWHCEMPPSPRRLRQQIPALQESLRPAVAPREPVVAHQMLVEVPRGEALIARPIQAPRPPRTGPPAPAGPTPCRSGDPAGQPRLLLRSGGTNGGRSVRPTPSNSAASNWFSSAASQRPNTSMNFSIRTPCRASVRRILPTSKWGQDYRTDRVLPKPDISCASLPRWAHVPIIRACRPP